MKSLFPFLLLFILCGCKRDPETSKLYLVTYFKEGVQDNTSKSFIRLSQPQLQPAVFEFNISDTASLQIDVGEKILRYPVTQKGVYLLNLSPDTLVSIPVLYGPDKNAVATKDSFATKERIASGETNILVVTPTDMQRISADRKAKLYVFTIPPDERDAGAAWYQVQTTKYWLGK